MLGVWIDPVIAHVMTTLRAAAMYGAPGLPDFDPE
jgi:hypothetical protein